MEELKKGLMAGFVDGALAAQEGYVPHLVSNRPEEGKKVLSVLEEELRHADAFFISVAFITKSGITPLLQTLRELEEKGVPGKILTTDYLTFTEPDAVRKLSSLKNIDVKMYMTNGKGAGFHTKGYIFKRGRLYRFITGSANMTQQALTVNKEWNTGLVSSKNGAYAKEILREYASYWESEKAFFIDDVIDAYAARYRIAKEQKKVALEEDIVDFSSYTLMPNKMQTVCVENFRVLLEKGEKRGLLVSSTGTGKTYASAFTMRELGFKKVLFVVHRNQIAKQALKSYRKVFGGRVSMGQVTGKHQDYDADYIFATVQTLSKDETLKLYARDHFEAIVIDEAHHSSAKSYKKVMDYFTPRLWFGMTATPDKRDDNMEGRNIYEIFHHQIACEIRLQDAMEEDLLCPFHYFGITDLEVITDTGKSREEKIENFRFLTSDERVRNIIRQAEYFGFSGDRVKGLIFCSRIEEARALSRKFNERGLRTLALSGSDSEEARAEAVERLAGQEGPEALDYILSVDIFSEGVDIPEINQVIMLRPTQSPIVFVQQLGRGLRKAENKEYVVVIDFIGNYKNNFMIPIALSGDRTYNKDNVRRYVHEGGRAIPGSSTVHFDGISRKRIYQALDNANFNALQLIKENYFNLKNKLGHIPSLTDFDRYGEMDVLRIFDNSSCGSYYKFLSKYEKDYKRHLSEEEEQVIEFVSKKLASGKRVQELELLKGLLTERHGVFERLSQTLKDKYHKALNKAGEENIINVMTNVFPTGASVKTYHNCVFIEKEQSDYGITKPFAGMLEHEDFYAVLEELIGFGLSRYERDYRNTYQDTDFVLYKKYTYEDTCRLLNWENNLVPLNIGGYKYDEKTKTFPVFINYDKSDKISDTIKYEDHFVGENRLIAISKSGRTKDSQDVQNFLKARERDIDVQLFVRKNKDDKISKEFYYLGRMSATGKTEEIVMPHTDKTAVEIEWILDTPVREDLYQYFISNE